VVVSNVTTGGPATEAIDPPLAAILPRLRRLDQRLEKAVSAMNAEARGDAAPFRGLYITPDDVRDLLGREPGAIRFGQDTEPGLPEPGDQAESSLAWLSRAFGLTPFDLDVVLLAFAPELDLRYEKLYAYLQDDVTRKRATVDLALNLFCASAAEKVLRRSHFAPDAPLIRDGLLSIAPDPNDTQASLLSHDLRLDVEITRLLLGEYALHPRLVGFCALVEPQPQPEPLPGNADARRVLPHLAKRALAESRPLRVYFQCRNEIEGRNAAAALAASLGRRLLTVLLNRVTEAAGLSAPLRLVLRTARIHGAILYVSGLDDLKGQEGASHRGDVLDALAEHDGVTILAGRQRWVPEPTTPFGIIPIALDAPDFAGRVACWTGRLAESGCAVEGRTLNILAGRFALTRGQIADAVETAVAGAQLRIARDAADAGSPDEWVPAPPSLEDLSAAARSQCGHELGKLARKIESRYGWDDIVLSPDASSQLREICQQVEHRHVVYGDWGFGRKLSLGKGINVLFCGPPGTGKTMGAEVIARELQLDLYRIDLSQIVSKYIGDTEKNLDRIFVAAESSNAILFFDEADALFGKRSEVRDSHDRYANIEISYLLQKMEEYQGISILATNLRQNLDEAFVRRLQVIVEFAFPDEEHRLRIWRQVFPHEAPIAEDAQFELLAREAPLAGGNIKNMALVAAAYAAADGGVIHMAHLVRAAHREHQKLGRSLNGALAAIHRPC